MTAQQMCCYPGRRSCTGVSRPDCSCDAPGFHYGNLCRKLIVETVNLRYLLCVRVQFLVYVSRTYTEHCGSFVSVVSLIMGTFLCVEFQSAYSNNRDQERSQERSHAPIWL
jgi:hypothetical protein